MSERSVAPSVPPHQAMVEEVREGLSRAQKELPPKFFYDVRGSELFEEITQLPEYYLSRTERVLLERWMPEWVADMQPRSLVELGAGSGAKTRIILDAMRAVGEPGYYLPIDVSAEFLRTTTELVRLEYPGITAHPLVADIGEAFDLPADLPRPMLYAFLGSTIGNFAPDAAAALLGRVRRAMRFSDRFLMGVDLRKDVGRIEAAYNDVQGVTAAFNLNMLHVLNRRLGADFEVAAFEHRASYDVESHCIEMHLVSRQRQRVSIPGAGVFELRAGETIRTEISCKHDLESITGMFNTAGLQLERWESDPEKLFAVILGAPTPTP
ncbi:L-histidine N(alpha)-methyltransferase [soil metagenome]